jgi:hypothetical protein
MVGSADSEFDEPSSADSVGKGRIYMRDEPSNFDLVGEAGSTWYRIEKAGLYIYMHQIVVLICVRLQIGNYFLGILILLGYCFYN